MKKKLQLAAIRQHSPAILFLVQIVIALLFAIPAAEQAARSADQSSTVTVTTDQTPRLGKIYFDTPVADAQVGVLQQLPILVDTGGANINTVAFTISVPIDAVRLDSLDLTQSFCTIITQQTVSVNAGIVQFSCGTPNPGLRSQIGTVGVLEYKPLRSGAVIFHIDPTSASLLANDGHGSEVLRGVEDRSVIVASNGNTTVSGVHVPLVSKSHTISTTCSGKDTATFAWLRPAQTDHFEYDFNTNPDTLVRSTSTTDLEISLPTVPNTVQYFHVRAVINGEATPVSTYEISTCGTTEATSDTPLGTAENPVSHFFHTVWNKVSSLWNH